MRLPRVRFTVRWLMIATAIVGLLLAGGRWSVEMWMERQRRLEQVAEQTRRMIGIRSEISRGRKLLATRSEPERTRAAKAIDAYERRKIEYHGRLRTKYERAALLPWLPVPPD